MTSNLSSDYYLNNTGCMVAANEKTIKLIYEIQDINLMLIFNMFGAWPNDHNRTLRGSDCDRNTGEVCANGNAPHVIERSFRSNCMITGNADSLEYCRTFGDLPL